MVEPMRDPQWLDWWADIGMIQFCVRPIRSTVQMTYPHNRYYTLNVYEDSGTSSQTIEFCAWDIQHAQRLADTFIAEYIDESIMGGECKPHKDLRSITMANIGDSYQRLMVG